MARSIQEEQLLHLTGGQVVARVEGDTWCDAIAIPLGNNTIASFFRCDVFLTGVVSNCLHLQCSNLRFIPLSLLH